MNQVQVLPSKRSYIPRLPATDHHEELAPSHLHPGDSFQLKQGPAFVIHYRDAVGQESVRRISVGRVWINKQGVPCLLAYCFGRDDVRMFRIDRVLSVADLDGVLQEPLSKFWHDQLELTWPPADIMPAH